MCAVVCLPAWLPAQFASSTAQISHSILLLLLLTRPCQYAPMVAHACSPHGACCMRGQVCCDMQEGMIALWRGWLPSVIGVIPYVGLNFSVYETLKDMTLKHYRECPTPKGSTRPPHEGVGWHAPLLCLNFNHAVMYLPVCILRLVLRHIICGDAHVL